MSANSPCTAVVLAGAVLILAGCSIRSGPPPEFTDRSPLVSCGEIVLAQGDTVPPGAIRCMDEAAGKSGAELSISSPTTEGDAIISYFRVGPEIDGIDQFVDATRDSFGPRRWTYQHCRGNVTISEYGACTAR
ncbi:hypothetical protein F1C58_05320 [Glaciihabitans sp. INWT7]|uniref:hypothetical protein n=1 Tax=Glaciihabitans sp. INWT7 TaxID=2596912 RepID=UPI001628FC24|nr:hypothetical protein [Glaciihabitans sp. INWT7]QNE46386.1 hypothetical protein F1C58_05320 [Glaciihabitans sp. INWT7]